MGEANDNVSEIPQKGFDFSYEAFENTPVFVQGVRKVYNCETFPSIKSAYKVKRLMDSVQSELKNYVTLRKEIKDDDENRDVKLKELHEITVPVKWGRLTFEELSAVQGISPADLMALEHIVEPNAFETALS